MKIPQKEINHILIFRALQLGDMLCVIPALRALRKAYPNAAITLAGLPWAKMLVNRFPQYFTSFIHFPGYPGLPEQPVNALAFTAFLQTVQQAGFDLVLQMQGNGTIVNPMIELLNAKYIAGFFTKGDYRPNEEYFIEYPAYGHEIERHLLLMDHLGIPSQGNYLEFPVTDADHEDLAAAGLPVKAGQYVCIHPGSRAAWRQWPPSYFAMLGDYCFEQGLAVVITGTPDELELASSVAGHMRYTPIIAAGKTSLGAVAALIQNAYMLICNCTGVSHIASALKTPAIVISMDGEPERWGPLDKQLHRTINWLQNADYDFVFAETKLLMQQLSSKQPHLI